VIGHPHTTHSGVIRTELLLRARGVEACAKQGCADFALSTE
jgi:hypothetical protein